MEEIPWEKRFHFGDGTAAKDLAELKAKIESISYEEFYRHVNAEKNDFANWTEHVLQKKALADRLRRVSSIVETVELLNEELQPAAGALEEQADFQKRIEETLFEEPKRGAEEELPEIQFEEPAEGKGVEERVLEEEKEEPKIPSREELDFAGRTPGAPVTTAQPAHTSIRELSERHAAKHTEEQMRFFVRQFVYGFLFGIVVGLILGRVITLLG